MTISAVDSETGNVMFVTERNRLFADDILFGDIRRTDDASPHPGQKDDQGEATEDRKP